MLESSQARTTAYIAAGVAAALVVGGSIGWLMRTPDIDRLTRRIDELESVAGTGTAETTAATGPQSPPATEQPPVEPPVVDTGDREGSTGPTDRQPGLVLEVIASSGSPVLRVDYVQFLTGGEAADAATVHGDESPPPNDYYIVNDNPWIREFPIQASIPVTVVTNNDGTSDPAGHTITLDQWIAALSGPSADAYKASLYWVTTSNGIVTEIDAQYVP